MRILAISCLSLTLLATACSPIQGQRFWWNDQKREKLPNDYTLPDWPAQAPVPAGDELYVPKPLPEDEVKRATAAQQKMIEEGIPRSGVPDPLTNRQKIPVAKWEGGASDDADIKDAKKEPAPAAKTAAPGDAASNSEKNEAAK